MWVRSQNGEHILEVERFRKLPLPEDPNTIRILAKLDRDTVILGDYPADQAESIWLDLWHIVGMDQPYRTNYFTMPPCWGEDEE